MMAALLHRPYSLDWPANSPPMIGSIICALTAVGFQAACHVRLVSFCFFNLIFPSILSFWLSTAYPPCRSLQAQSDAPPARFSSLPAIFPPLQPVSLTLRPSHLDTSARQLCPFERSPPPTLDPLPSIPLPPLLLALDLPLHLVPLWTSSRRTSCRLQSLP